MTQTRRDAAELNLLLEAADAAEYWLPSIAARLREHGASTDDFAMAIDTPFGVDGPAVLELGDMCALLFSRGMIQSSMRLSDPSRLILPYTQLMMAFLLLCPEPRRIEMIGLGGGSLAKYCHRFLPNADITVIEVDPRVIALRERFGIPRDGERFRVVCADGADFVDRDPSRPDVILVDGFTSHGQPTRLCSTAFYADCRERLSDDGILVANLCDNVLARRLAKSRLRRVFRGGLAIVQVEHQQNRLAFGFNNGRLPLDGDEIRSTASRLSDHHLLDFEKLAARLAKAFIASGLTLEAR